MRAVDVPPSCPANHISSTDFTFGPIHDVSTGLAVFSTTIVFGFAAATALIRSMLACDSALTQEIVGGLPLGFGQLDEAPTPSLTNTIALLLPAAAAAASAMS